MKRFFLINIFTSIVLASYFYLFLDKDQREQILTENPLISALPIQKNKAAFKVYEKAKETQLNDKLEKLNLSLKGSKIKFLSIDLTRSSKVINQQVNATNTLSFQLEKKPFFGADIENEAKRLMKHWIKIYKHDANENSILVLVHKGNELYKINSKNSQF